MITKNIVTFSPRVQLVELGLTSYDYAIRAFNRENRESITPAVLIQYLREYAKTGVKLTSVQFKKTILMKAFWATYSDRMHDRGFVEDAIWQFRAYKIPRSAGMIYYEDIPSREDTLKVLSSPAPLKTRIAIQFLAQTGLRISELTGIRLKDCQIKGDRVFVTILGKGTRYRRIFYPRSFHEQILSAYESTDYLFPARDGKRLPSNCIGNSIRRYTKLYTGTQYSPHKFRHAFVTHMLASGASLKAVSMWVGHSTTATTANMYQHERLSDADFQKAFAGVSI